MRERDEFTSVNQLERMAKRMRGEEGANGGGIVDIEIVPGVGHFELESPGSLSSSRGRFWIGWIDSSIVHRVVISLGVYFCCEEDERWRRRHDNQPANERQPWRW